MKDYDPRAGGSKVWHSAKRFGRKAGLGLSVFCAFLIAGPLASSASAAGGDIFVNEQIDPDADMDVGGTDLGEGDIYLANYLVYNEFVLEVEDGTRNIGFATFGNRLLVVDGGEMKGLNTDIQLASSHNVFRLEGGDSPTTQIPGVDASFATSGSLTVGVSGSYNDFSVSFGASASVGAGVFIGSGLNSKMNVGEVTGERSVLTNSGAFTVGGLGNDNFFSISDGGKVTSGNGNVATIGAGNSVSSGNGRRNSVTLSGAGSIWTNTSASIVIGEYGSENELLIQHGGKVVTEGDGIIGQRKTGEFSSDGNRVRVNGEGSQWELTGAVIIGDEGSNNSLFIEDGALVKADDLKFNLDGVEGERNNFLYLADGFLALSGERGTDLAAFISASLIKVQEGDKWVVGGLDSFTYEYFDVTQAAEAQAFSGYSGLANYTIITTIPEPSTWALLGATLLGTLPLLRRMRRS